MGPDLCHAVVFRLAEESYFRARSTGLRSDWSACVSNCNAYLSIGGKGNIHVYMNFALNELGMVTEALQSCLAGLRIDPSDCHLLHNRSLYEAHLCRTHERA